MSDLEVDSGQHHSYSLREERLALFSQIKIVGRVLDTLPDMETEELRVEIAEDSARQRRAMAKLGTSGIYYGN